MVRGVDFILRRLQTIGGKGRKGMWSSRSFKNHSGCHEQNGRWNRATTLGYSVVAASHVCVEHIKEIGVQPRPYDVALATYWKSCPFRDMRWTMLKTPLSLQCSFTREGGSEHSQWGGRAHQIICLLHQLFTHPTWGRADVNGLPGPQGEPSRGKLGGKS